MREQSSVGIIVTARVKSSRIKEKVLQRINGRETINILLDHVINDKFPVVLAIPDDAENDILETIGIDRGIEVYRGQNDSPFARMAEVAKKYNFEHIVRITADDILIDLTLLFNQVRMHIGGGHEYTFMSRCPGGVAGEVFQVRKYLQVVDKARDKSIEHVSYYFKNQCKTFEYYPPREYQHSYRLTMDYPEDLLLLQVLFSALRPGFGTLDAINFLSKNDTLLKINHLPVVTVFTCVYNGAKYILDAVKSVMSQTFADFEYIIIDDKSTDGTIELLTEYYTALPVEQRAKIKILRNENNLDLASSSNRAIEEARGKYVVRFDADDILRPEFLQDTINQLKFDNVLAMFSAFDYIDGAGALISECRENKFLPSCCLFSAWVVNELKFRDGLRFMDGEEFFARFKKIYKHGFIDHPLWYYRQHPEQKTKSPDYKKITEVKE